MPDLSQVRPLAAGAGVRPGLLARVSQPPPPLGLGVGGDGRHVSLEVIAVVLEVAEQRVFPQEDAVVADIRGTQRGLNPGPDLAVQGEVLFTPFRAQPDRLGESSDRHELLRCLTRTARFREWP